MYTAGSVQSNTEKQKIFDQPVVRTSIKSTINLRNSTIVLKFYNCMMVAYRVGGGGEGGGVGVGGVQGLIDYCLFQKAL